MCSSGIILHSLPPAPPACLPFLPSYFPPFLFLFTFLFSLSHLHKNRKMFVGYCQGFGCGVFFCIYEIRYCFNIYRFRTLQFYTRVFVLYKSRSKQKQISNPNKLRHSIVPVLRILHFSQFNCYFFL